MPDSQHDAYAPPSDQPRQRRPHPDDLPPPADGLAIASFVLGILSLTIGCCCCYGLPLNIIGLILGIVSQSREKTWQALTGIILCSVSLGLAILMILLGVGVNLVEQMGQF